VQALADHHHCKTCGNPCDPTEDTCSVECAERRKAALDSRRTTTYVLYGIMALIVLLFLVSYVRI
jgi:predicted nucleic acid-binding Zn ribbon protein